ncbi:Hypothetical_protein [Hexamita inflata]|uniref:Hypothetical_protein n=1 Tax=Hexamita inflata TaxID=28002 RepID=A0AA86P2M8_9EUKA|nr:Hypothetical protein HINF_LOCUS17126 [Hexamita inflata]
MAVNSTFHDYINNLSVKETELRLEEIFFTSEQLMMEVVRTYTLVFNCTANTRYCFFNSKSDTDKRTSCAPEKAVVLGQKFGSLILERGNQRFFDQYVCNILGKLSSKKYSLKQIILKKYLNLLNNTA